MWQWRHHDDVVVDDAGVCAGGRRRVDSWRWDAVQLWHTDWRHAALPASSPAAHHHASLGHPPRCDLILRRQYGRRKLLRLWYDCCGGELGSSKRHYRCCHDPIVISSCPSSARHPISVTFLWLTEVTMTSFRNTAVDDPEHTRGTASWCDDEVVYAHDAKKLSYVIMTSRDKEVPWRLYGWRKSLASLVVWDLRRTKTGH